MSLIFQVVSGLGTFLPEDPKAAEQQRDQLRQIVAQAEDGEQSPKKIIRAIKNMIGKDPLFLRGYALAGEILGNAGEDDKASELYVKGCRATLKIIPETYQGPLDLDNADVQCFLSCHAGYVEALVAKGDYAAALEASHRQLAFDPDDQFDRRRELGELSIMTGRLDEAESILNAQLEERATAWYSLAYLALQNHDFVTAATRLRRAFVLAPYAVDFLTGRLTAPNIFWEQGPRAPEPHDDLLYVEMLGGDLWSENKTASEFIIWLSQTASALGERSAMVSLSERCFVDEISDEEAEMEFRALWASIDADSSTRLTRRVRDPREGRELYPWEMLALDQARSMEEDQDPDEEADDDED
ncbi:MAG: tetratricopeptide repeat protein [Candidatus Adiutrix sp.]|jgi:tetratricopeptide (TPR) repeat protein|nr:tetratricopeptide repeat protein [Candidatus Adiutrix sp.]